MVDGGKKEKQTFLTASRLVPLVWLLLVMMLVTVAAYPLIKPGFIPTHDGEYHIIRFSEFSSMLSAGSMFPRWAPNLNSGYGVPLFTFHYPLPNYVGAAYHALGFTYADAVKLTLLTGYVLSALFSWFWLRRLFGLWPATVGAVAGSFVPYWFVDLYVRGSVGEVLAIAWVFLALYALEARKKYLCAAAISFLILSHNILAMIFLPFLVMYMIVRAVAFFPSLLLGILLASYFWIPAILERSYVVGLNTVSFSDHFTTLAQLIIPSWGTGFSRPGAPYDEMSQQVGLVPLGILLVCLFILWREKDPNIRRICVATLICCSIALFLMTEQSQAIWQMVAFLSFIQYPWRFLSIVIPSTALLGAYSAERVANHFVSFVVLVLAVVVALPYTKPVVYKPRDDAYYLSRREFTDGTSSLGNAFSTIWSAWRDNRPAQRIDLVWGVGEITTVFDTVTNKQFALKAQTPVRVRLNTLYYPGWNVFVDNKQQMSEIVDGVMETIVPKGMHKVEVKFQETSLRLLADLISVGSLFWLLAWGILDRIYARRNRYIADVITRPRARHRDVHKGIN